MSKKSITIDNQEYELAKLNPEARQQLANLRVADQEIARLQVQIALAQTARNAYGQALKAELEKS
ncbi:MAG: hypothetical protein H3C26_06425 [Rhodocyclaceae bacterium]|nr:hypothetical protein [Rhodocyclaceae bacterium]